MSLRSRTAAHSPARPDWPLANTGRDEIDPDALDTIFGQMPLCWAAENNNEGIANLLLGREDVNPNTANTTYGQTPCMWAIGGGHERVVKLLLGREDINLNTADSRFGQTPVS